MYPITYSHAFNYRLLAHVGPARTFPAIEIILQRGDKKWSGLAIIDTGSMYSLFSYNVGTALGLNVPAGQPQRLETLGGLMTAYRHKVELEIAHGWSLGDMEVLFAETNISRNLLGRSDFLIRVQLGLDEQRGMIYLGRSE